MANVADTLAGILELSDANNFDIDVSNLFDSAPAIRALAAVTSTQGTDHKYMRETVAAGSAFRAINGGIDNASETVEQVTVNLKLLDATVKVDQAATKAFKGGEGAYMAARANAALRAAFFQAEKQFFQGTNNSASGFSGLEDWLYTDDVGDTFVVPTASGAAGKNVWLVRSTPADVALVSNGELEVGDLHQTFVSTSGTTGFAAWQLPIMSWLGVQFGSINTVARIYNLDGTSGNELTDDLIGTALSKFPAGMGATHIFMDRTSAEELRQSRTATNPSGNPAGIVENVFGIPVVVSDGVGSTDAPVTTT
jgi:hypothetical protein